jgi:hypothetical protein
MLPMLLAGLAGAAQAAPPDVAQLELLDAFQSLCLVDFLSEDALASAAGRAGFERAPVAPAAAENRETAAWTRGGLRMFTTSGQRDPRWQLPPMCGVTAEVSGVRNARALARAVAERSGAFFMSGSPGPEHASLTLVGPDRFVHLGMNRPRHGRASVVLMAYPKGRE